MTLRSINPATGETIAEFPELSPREAASTVDAAAEAFSRWRRTTFEERSRFMRLVAADLRTRAADLARLMALEMGKPVRQGRAEIEKCAVACEYYAEGAARFLAPETVSTEARKSYISYAPLGVVLAVMPWNFPFWQVFRFAAPALMAGNTCVLKHASNVSGSAIAIGEAFASAGFPDGVFRVALVGSGGVDALVAHPAVKAVTLTGSAPAGSAVAEKAGSLLKKTVLELGGSDPYVILEDADLASAAEVCAASRLTNSGQSCIAAKRFIVPERIAESFTRLFLERMLARATGNPLDESTDVGPLARSDLRDDLHRQVAESVAAGARLLAGGTVPPGAGAYYPVTVLSAVEKGMPACDEELFGPVGAIIAVRDEEEAIAAANDTSFGLGAAVFSGDLERAERIAREHLDAGSCFVNALVKSDPRLPFGGIKESGYGRELGVFGIREFVNVKTVYVA